MTYNEAKNTARAERLAAIALLETRGTDERTLARRLGRSRRELRLMRRNGLAPIAVSVGRKVYYRDEDVRDWLRRRGL